jgi:serine O-acetyltransferase
LTDASNAKHGSAKLSKLADDIRADYSLHNRSLLDPGFWVMASYHLGCWAAQRKGAVGAAASIAYKVSRTVQEFTTGTIVSRGTLIGEGARLIHATGIRIAPDAVIGKNVAILHNVTIGTNHTRPGFATIGDNVFIGANATILGPVHIGNGAHVAANSLVLQDVPDNCTAIGVPARIMKYTTRETE